MSIHCCTKSSINLVHYSNLHADWAQWDSLGSSAIYSGFGIRVQSVECTLVKHVVCSPVCSIPFNKAVIYKTNYYSAVDMLFESKQVRGSLVVCAGDCKSRHNVAAIYM